MEFYEQVVKQKKNGKDYGVIAATVLVGLLLVAIFFFVIPVFLPLWIFVACWFGYFSISSRCLEYEYSITEHTVDVDRIAGKRRRRKMIVIELKELQGYGKVGDGGYRRAIQKGLQVLDFSSRTHSEQTFYFIVPRPKGTYVVVLEPDEELLDSINHYLPQGL